MFVYDITGMRSSIQPNEVQSSGNVEAFQPLDAIVLSDLHLGSPNSQVDLLVHLLSEILHGEICTSRLILNGDVFDSIDFRRLRKLHWKVLSLIRKLSDRMDVVWLAGNHDGSANIVSHLLGVRVLEECVLVSGQRRILIFHGHQYDRFIQDHPIVTLLADTAYSLLQKLDRRHAIARLAKRSSKIFLRCEDKIRTGARASAARHGCDAVICGHTHRAVEDDSKDIIYYNSGCWTERPCHYLAIQRGRIELRQHDLELCAIVKDLEPSFGPGPLSPATLLPLAPGAFAASAQGRFLPTSSSATTGY